MGYGELSGDNKSIVSSIRVQTGCSLKIFKNPNKVNLLATLINYDITRAWMNPNNDTVSSYICECEGMNSE